MPDVLHEASAGAALESVSVPSAANVLATVKDEQDDKEKIGGLLTEAAAVAVVEGGEGEVRRGKLVLSTLVVAAAAITTATAVAAVVGAAVAEATAQYGKDLQSHRCRRSIL